MAERPLRMWPDPVLSQICASVDPTNPAVSELIADLFDTMYCAKGRGLAAPQIGALERVFVVDVSWKEGAPDPRAFINPEIVQAGEPLIDMDEQCLSIPDLPMTVSRPSSINMTWLAPTGQAIQAHLDGILARCVLHELDHLNGTVILDHQSRDDRAALEARYGA